MLGCYGERFFWKCPIMKRLDHGLRRVQQVVLGISVGVYIGRPLTGILAFIDLNGI